MRKFGLFGVFAVLGLVLGVACVYATVCPYPYPYCNPGNAIHVESKAKQGAGDWCPTATLGSSSEITVTRGMSVIFDGSGSVDWDSHGDPQAVKDDINLVWSIVGDTQIGSGYDYPNQYGYPYQSTKSMTISYMFPETGEYTVRLVVNDVPYHKNDLLNDIAYADIDVIVIEPKCGTHKGQASYGGVNTYSGNLLREFPLFGTSCPSGGCGGSAGANVYIPVAVLNTMSLDTAGPFGPKFRFPLDVWLDQTDTTGDGTYCFVDSDGTQRTLVNESTSASIDDERLVWHGEDPEDGLDVIRHGGTVWHFNYQTHTTSSMHYGRLTSIEDRYGNTTQITYDDQTPDEDSRLAKVIDRFGRETRFTWNTGIDRIVEVDQQDGDGDYDYKAYLEYEEASPYRLTEIWTPINDHSDPYAHPQISFEYDDVNRRLLVSDGHYPAHTTTYQFDANGLTSTITDPMSEQTVYLYNQSDESGTFNRVTNRRGYNTDYCYDANGLLQWTRDATSHVVNYEYSSALDLTATWYERTFYDIGTPYTKTLKTEYDYDDHHNVTEERSGYMNGSLVVMSTTVYEYDYDPIYKPSGSNDLRRKTDDPDGLNLVTEYWYYTESSQNTSTGAWQGYDPANGDVWKVIAYPDGYTTGYPTHAIEVQVNEYNTDGTIATTTDGNVKTTTYEYDYDDTGESYGLPTAIIDPEGIRTESDYDVRGRMIASRAVSAGGDRETEYAYDELDRLVTIFHPQDEKEYIYTYDCCYLLSVTDENEMETSYEYDANHRPEYTTDALGSWVHNQYDEEGNLQYVTWQRTPYGEESPNEVTTEYQYDELNRQTEVEYPDETSESYLYDESGNRYKRTDGNSVDTWYYYHEVNRLVKIDYPTGTDTEYTYDTAGRRTDMSDSIGTTHYVYDDASRLTDVTYNYGTGDAKTVSYDLDPAGWRESMTVSGAGTWEYTYYNNGMLETVTNPQSLTTTYYYYDWGSLEEVDHGNDTYTEYEYTSRGFLDTVTHYLDGETPTVIESFEYDRDYVGNSEAVTLSDGSYIEYGYDDAYRLTSEVKYADSSKQTTIYSLAWEYDEPGNRISMTVDGGTPITYTYLDNNQLDSSSDGWSYEYDNNGNMTLREKQGEPTTSYTYSYANKMLTLQVGQQSAWQYGYDGNGVRRYTVSPSAVTTNSIYDGASVVAEYNGNWALQAAYTHGAGGLLSMYRDSATRVYHYDDLGSAWVLTDDDGDTTDTYTYDAWGNALPGGSGSTANPYCYVGKLGYHNDGTGLMLLGARYYDPAIGRFITQDPIGYAGGLNLYAYAGANPVVATDPSGLAVWKCWKRYAIIGIEHEWISTDTCGAAGFYPDGGNPFTQCPGTVDRAQDNARMARPGVPEDKGGRCKKISDDPAYEKRVCDRIAASEANPPAYGVICGLYTCIQWVHEMLYGPRPAPETGRTNNGCGRVQETSAQTTAID